jgi:electron transport complex protein RnfC
MDWLRAWFPKSFSHGVHPPPWKTDTEARVTRRLPFAPRLILPLSQHLGAPSVPIVRPGQEVVRGEPIARANGFVSVPVHAPATGVIEGIELWPTARGPKAEAIVLRVYEGSTQEVLYSVPRHIGQLAPREIVQAIQDTGMVGLGGAAFPSHVKLASKPDRPIDTLIANGCECEPYLTTDHRMMVEHPGELVRGIHIALKALGAKQAIIGIEDNKRDAFRAVRAALRGETANAPSFLEGRTSDASRASDSARGPRLDSGMESRATVQGCTDCGFDPIGERAIRAELVRTKYPQGSERMLIKTLLGREIPANALAHDLGVCVNNVSTLAEIGMLLEPGIGLIERVMTLVGPGVQRPGNYLVPLGTPLGFLLEQAGFEGTAEEVILGGPMMGGAVASLDVPVTKGVTGVLVLNEAAIATETRKQYACINCGRCVEACPMHLNPSQLGLLAAKREYARMSEQYNLDMCFECGCCSYVCPSGIPLVQYFRIAKTLNREARERERAA